MRLLRLCDVLCCAELKCGSAVSNGVYLGIRIDKRVFIG